MARFLRLVLTLVVLVGGPVSTIASGLSMRPTAQEAASARQHATRAAGRNDAITDALRGRSSAGDVGERATSPTSAVRRGTRARSNLFSLLSQALGETPASDNDEFEVGDAPDLGIDECPQGFVTTPCADLSLPRLTALYVERNLWGIGPAIGHPRGDDEPPRV